MNDGEPSLFYGRGLMIQDLEIEYTEKNHAPSKEDGA